MRVPGESLDRGSVRRWSATSLLGVLVGLMGAGWLGPPEPVMAQGPALSYFHDPATELAWGECVTYQPGGSRQKVPALPALVRDPVRAPAGTRAYTADIEFDGPVVFVGDGLAGESGADPYAGLEPEGSVVMMRLDSTGLDERPGLFERRVMTAADRGAQAVVVFSLEDEARFPVLRPGENPGFEDVLPVIAVSRETARRLLISGHPLAGSWLDDWQATETAPPSQALSTRLECSFTGRFERYETPNFSFRYRQAAFDESEIVEVAELNERSLEFLLELFQPEALSWRKVPTLYFRGFDSKVFYTFHWGKGLATPGGSYLVYEGAPDWGLIVHENAHTLLDQNWGETISFLSEGAGRLAEARATDPLMNHRETQGFLAQGKWFALEEMVTFSIGEPGLKTDLGYPAAGSFVEFLIEIHGLARFKEICQLEGESPGDEGSPARWQRVFGKTLQQLEDDWRPWLERQLEP